MAFNTRYTAEKRVIVSPKNLRFTQPDIKYTFSDPTYPSLRESVCLIQRGELDPAVFGDLHVSMDKEGHMWCDNNRRLFVLREAGVHSVHVVFDGTRRPKKSLRGKLSDPAFMPRIRGEASRVQSPPPPTSGRNAYRMQNKTSLLGSVSSGYWKRQIYNSHQDHEVDSEHSDSSEEESALKDKYPNEDEDEDELEVRFKQLDIKSAFSKPPYSIDREWASLNQRGELDPDLFDNPTVHRDKKGVMGHDNNCRLYAHKEAEVDSLPVKLYGNRCRKNALESKRNDWAFVPMVTGGASGDFCKNALESKWDNFIPMVTEGASGDYRKNALESKWDAFIPMVTAGAPRGAPRESKWDAYVPMVTAGAPRVQIPPLPTSGQNAYQMGKETSLPGSVFAGYSVKEEYDYTVLREDQEKFW